MLSYWEKQSLLSYDIIIVGSGIVGLSTAVSIKEKDSAKRVLVLERGILPTGASTKNAGFACIGSLTEILDDLRNMGEAKVIQLVQMRVKGLKKLRSRLGDKQLGYAEKGSYELISPNEENVLDGLGKINSLLKPVLSKNAFAVADKKVSGFGFNTSYVKHLIKNNLEGELHTGKMMRALIDLCLLKGIEIKTGCEVLKVEEDGTSAKVIVRHAVNKEQITFTASDVIICTNAFTKELYPELDIEPGRGQVIITKPVKSLKFKGIFHFDRGYYYFRELNGKVLFGGGRNLDFETESTTELEINKKIQNDLMKKLQTIILLNQKFEIEDSWAGIMAFGTSKFPLLVKKSERIWLGVRMGGMGVAIGSEVGEQLSEMVMNSR